jgi:5-bromo-4-chloroindolyl phosphate hydrolysis protein
LIEIKTVLFRQVRICFFCAKKRHGKRNTHRRQSFDRDRKTPGLEYEEISHTDIILPFDKSSGRDSEAWLFSRNIAYISRSLIDIYKNLVDISKNLRNIRKNLADIRNNLADIRKNFTDVRKNLTDVRKNFTDVRKNFTDVRKNFTDVRKIPLRIV